MLVLVIGIFFPQTVAAVDRKATISGPSSAEIGKNITITVGFSPKALTRTFQFDLTYDSNLLEYKSVANISAIAQSASVNITGEGKLRAGIGIYPDLDDGKNVDKALQLVFLVKAKGSAIVKIDKASDGNYNSIQAGSSITINLTEAAPTTTTTKATTTTTNTTTTKATTSTTTETTTTTSTTSEVTVPYHPAQSLIGKRYDGVSLTVPESVPLDDTVPLSFEPAEVEWIDKHVTGYRPETLPYTLYWLATEEGEDGFYLYDDALELFVPYMRAKRYSLF